MWMTALEGLPFLNFKAAVKKYDWVMLPHATDTVNGLILKKEIGVENEIIDRLPKLDEYIETFLEENDRVRHRNMGESVLDNAVWDILGI
jgi:hypothetical protein